MLTIFKKELHTYAGTMIGAAALAILLLLTGFVTRYVNYYNGYSSYGYTLQMLMLWFFMIAVPLLTMRTFAEEFRLRTDQLLFAAPVRIRDIVLGKYLALLVMLLIPVGVMGIYERILSLHGKLPEALDAAALLLFFLMGCAYFSAGMFFSSVTENQIIAAVASVLFVLFTQLIGNLRTVIGAGRTGALLLVLAVILLLAVIFFGLTKKLYLSSVLFLFFTILAIIMFLAKGVWFEGGAAKILAVFDFRTMFFTAVMGTLDLRAVVFFLSYCAAGLLLTAYVLQRKTRALSAYETAVFPVLLLCILFLNLILGQLPKNALVRDISPLKLYTAGEETKETLEGLTEDVTLYYLTRSGEEDRDLAMLLEEYEALSGHIFLETIDLAVSPRFPEQFGEETLPVNSVIVRAPEGWKILRYDLFYPVSEENRYASYFDGEGQLTAAIDAVTDPTVRTVYCTRGHGEPAFDEGMKNVLEKLNLRLEEINLLTEEVPEESGILAIFAPSSDFTEEEIRKMEMFSEHGGAFFAVSLYSGGSFPLLEAFCASYGIGTVPGYVMEEDPSSYVMFPHLLLPVIVEASDVTIGFPDENILFPLAQGLVLSQPEGVSVNPLLFTSRSAFARTDSALTETRRTERDTAGPFALAALSEKKADESGKVSRMIFLTTPCALSQTVFSQVTGEEMSLPAGNRTLLVRCLASLSGTDAGHVIPPKAMSLGTLLIDEESAVRFGIAAMAIVPAVILLGGVLIFVRRRRR